MTLSSTPPQGVTHIPWTSPMDTRGVPVNKLLLIWLLIYLLFQEPS